MVVRGSRSPRSFWGGAACCDRGRPPVPQKERRREASVPLDADETGSARHEDRLPLPMEMRIGAPATDGGVALREPVAKLTSQ